MTLSRFLPAADNSTVQPGSTKESSPSLIKLELDLELGVRPVSALLTAFADGQNSTVIVLGRNLYWGNLTIESGEGEVWSVAAASQGTRQQSFLNFVLAWEQNIATGSYTISGGRVVKGGHLKGALLQEGGKPKPAKDPCGVKLWTQIIESLKKDGTHDFWYIYEHWENCDKIQFFQISDDGKKVLHLIGEEITLTPGKSITKGGMTITPISHTLNDTKVSDKDKISGQAGFFYISGCEDASVVQYASNKRTFTAPKNDPTAKLPDGDSEDWHLDGGNPYPGTVKEAGKGTVSTDFPGAFPDDVAGEAKVKQLPSGAQVTYTWILETFFYCDKKLVAWASWGQSVTYTMGDNGKLTPGAPSPDPAKFHDPTEKSQSPGNK